MERAEEIKRIFEGKGTKECNRYTNDEIIEKLEDLQNSLSSVIFEFTHSHCCRDKEIVEHLHTLAADHSFGDSTLVSRLTGEIQNLGFTIASMKKGKNGERIVQQALQLLELNENVKILNNIALRDSTDQAEYDSIVLTPYGVFVLEVKNYKEQLHLSETGYLESLGQSEKTYNVIGRMNGKELLLRKALGNLLRQEYYHGIILLSNDQTPIVDDYHRMPVSYRNTIVKDIESYDHGEVYFTPEQINEIAAKLIDLDQPQYYPCKERCEQIIADFAVFMAQIENLSVEDIEEDPEMKTNEHIVTKVGHEQPKKHFSWGTFIGGAASGATALFLALIPVIFPREKTQA